MSTYQCAPSAWHKHPTPITRTHPSPTPPPQGSAVLDLLSQHRDMIARGVNSFEASAVLSDCRGRVRVRLWQVMTTSVCSCSPSPARCLL